MGSDVPVEVAAVLEDLGAQTAAVHPLGFVSFHSRHAVGGTERAAAFCCRGCWLRALGGGLHICTHQDSTVKQKPGTHAARGHNETPSVA